MFAYLPFASENATALRLLRLARVLRAARMLPQLRIIIIAVGKSLPGALGFVLAGTLLLYIYAMLGWLIFADSDPDHYGSLGRAALSLFVLVTLDGLDESIRAGLALSPWSILYFASYVLLGSFVLVNVLIGVVLNSLDEARRLEGANTDPPGTATRMSAVGAEDRLLARIAEARDALDNLEQSITAPAAAPPPAEEQTGAPLPHDRPP